MDFLLGSGSASQYQLQATNMVRAVEDGARHLARGAKDLYFGGTLLQLGYQY